MDCQKLVFLTRWAVVMTSYSVSDKPLMKDSRGYCSSLKQIQTQCLSTSETKSKLPRLNALLVAATLL